MMYIGEGLECLCTLVKVRRPPSLPLGSLPSTIWILTKCLYFLCLPTHLNRNTYKIWSLVSYPNFKNIYYPYWT